MVSTPLTDADLALPVTIIRITIHSMGMFFESDTRSGNHASIFLIVGPYASVRLNMTKAGPTDTMGTYTKSLCPFVVSNSSLHNIDLIAAGGVTVRHLIDYIHTTGMEKYRLAPSGVGCRFWVKSVIQGFESAGFVASSSPVKADGAAHRLRYNYSRDQAPEFEEIVPGSFA
ncbi:hypothetical protein MauCBS54593_000072 [Microsporum audouinii]